MVDPLKALAATVTTVTVAKKAAQFSTEAENSA